MSGSSSQGYLTAPIGSDANMRLAKTELHLPSVELPNQKNSSYTILYSRSQHDIAVLAVLSSC